MDTQRAYKIIVKNCFVIVILLYLQKFIAVPTHIQLQINAAIYLKDPESSSLGKKILQGSIQLIADLGFEDFTFKKLAQQIQSTEASVYRYFESKHKLLLYLVNWYWTWMGYRMQFEVANIECPKERLSKIIHLLTQKVMQDADFKHIDEVKLYEIVINESAKTYLTHEVDKENKEGDFTAYKNLVHEISKIVNEINPRYKFCKMLISNMIEGIHHQQFFANHLPKLTDIEDDNSLSQFYHELIFKTIEE